MPSNVELVAGLSYLSQKILLSVTKGREGLISFVLPVFGWLLYIIGLPFWLVIFFEDKKWITFAVEAGGFPAMVIGLYIAILALRDYRRDPEAEPVERKPPLVLHVVALLATIAGCFVSVWKTGFGDIEQLLELGIATGYLVGTFLLATAKKDARHVPWYLNGWSWYMLMNASTAILWSPLYRDRWFIMVQQIVSLGFVLWAIIQDSRTSDE